MILSLLHSKILCVHKFYPVQRTLLFNEMKKKRRGKKETTGRRVTFYGAAVGYVPSFDLLLCTDSE